MLAPLGVYGAVSVLSLAMITAVNAREIRDHFFRPEMRSRRWGPQDSTGSSKSLWGAAPAILFFRYRNGNVGNTSVLSKAVNT